MMGTLAKLELEKICPVNYRKNEDLKGTLFYMASNQVKGLVLEAKCKLYGMSEPNFFELIRKKQNNIVMHV
jgi:hypothetical protein